MFSKIFAEIPSSDGHWEFKTVTQLKQYLKEHEIVEFNCELNRLDHLTVSVPKFADSRMRYSKSKLESCLKHNYFE